MPPLDDISGVLGLLTIITGGISVLLLVSTKTLRDSRDDQEKRIAFLEAKSARDDKEIANQAGEINALQKVVTGEVHLVAIADLLEHHHNQAVVMWDELKGTLTHIDSTLVVVAKKGTP